MLNLTRYVGQTIVIGNDIRIIVIKIKRNQVYFGIDAPKEISVHRAEIYERIQDENKVSLL